MIPNDSDQNIGQEKYGSEALCECRWIVNAHMSVSVLKLMHGILRLYIYYYLYGCFRCCCCSRSVLHFTRRSLPLPLASFYFLFILWFIFISIQINPHSIYLLSSSVSSSSRAAFSVYMHTRTHTLYACFVWRWRWISLAWHFVRLDNRRTFYEIWPDNYDEDESFWKRPVISTYRRRGKRMWCDAKLKVTKINEMIANCVVSSMCTTYFI